ncbi:MAG: hypothetical protein H0T53_00185 [Herpetosiphonaceae bacterium]|nr:hypothetical protein [Herpetosiphonaceae bacterium]
MYHVPPSHRRLNDPWKTVPGFVLASSLIIAGLSALLMTVLFMVRYNDFFVPGYVGLYVLIAFYCLVRGFLLSSAIHVVAFLLLAPFDRPRQSIRTLVYSLVAFLAVGVMVRVTWDSPQPGEEAVALNRLMAFVLTPSALHVAAILWFDYRRNRPVPIDPAADRAGVRT